MHIIPNLFPCCTSDLSVARQAFLGHNREGIPFDPIVRWKKTHPIVSLPRPDLQAFEQGHFWGDNREHILWSICVYNLWDNGNIGRTRPIPNALDAWASLKIPVTDIPASPGLYYGYMLTSTNHDLITKWVIIGSNFWKGKNADNTDI